MNLLLNNNTTLEILDAERSDKDPIRDYDLGKRRNWRSVFGPHCYSWFFPITSAPMNSDGIIWMKKDSLFQSDLVQESL